MKAILLPLVRCFVTACIFATAISSGRSESAVPAPAPSSLSDAALFELHVLPEPLVPTAPTTAANNQQLVVCLQAFEKRAKPDDFAALESFLAENPKSPWRLSIQTNLGLLQYRTGYFSRCIDSFHAAWTEGKGATELKAKALADRAAGEYAKMLARVGRRDTIKTFLVELEERTLVGEGAQLLEAARQGVSSMDQQPDMSYRCGPLALANVLRAQGRPDLAAKTTSFKSSSQGTSLAEIIRFARSLGVDLQAIKRTPGSAVPIPAIIHWKVGHYAALVGRVGNSYLSRDPTFGNETLHTADALEAEASGYFLVPTGPLTTGWSEVDEPSASTIFGKGRTSDNYDNATTQNDHKSGGGGSPSPSAPSPTTSSAAPAIKPDSPCGMASYRFHTMLVSLHIQDTPLFYHPPYGYPINITITYNQKEKHQPSNFNYSHFGRSWTFNWLSYISDTPNQDGAVTLYVAGGGTQQFAFDNIRKTLNVQYNSQSALRKVSSNPIRYEQEYPDGSKDIFDRSDGGTFSGRKIFLTQRVDPHGNITTINYDARLRITGITDAIGQTTTLSYENSADPFLITKATDPFGRQAIFSYDGSSRLITSTDVIGLESRFAYNGAGDLVRSLTTPYGTTTFTHTATTEKRTIRLTATDPQGSTEVLEFNENDTLLPGSDPENTLPAGMALRNTVLGARNSYYWSKKAWQDSAEDYSQARLFHWMHTEDFEKAYDTLESEKPALENRIWYNYPDQPPTFNGATQPGSMNRPSKIGRRIDDGTTQLLQYSYNQLGRVTSMTDQVGRTTSLTYAPNGQDVLTVSQQTGATKALLATYTYNSQHLPLTATDAAGQTTTYTYFPTGQIHTVTNAKKETSTFTYYDADTSGKQRRGRLSRIDGAIPGATVSFDYDAFGRTAQVTGPDDYFLRFSYDVLDRLTRTIFPDDSYTETTYLHLDPQSSRDRLGRVTKYLYNTLRQLVAVTDPADRTVRFNWCKCGSLKQLIDAVGRVTAWQRDAAGRAFAKVYPDGSKINYDYEPFSGRLSAITDEKGQVKTFRYNLDDTVVSLTYTKTGRPTPNVSFTYDPDFRRLTSMTDGVGTTRYGYYPIDAAPVLGAGQLSSVTGPLPGATTNYAYDELARRIGYAINGIGETVTIDPLGRVSSVTNPLGKFSYAYVDATSRPDTIFFPGGMSCAYAYQPLNGDFRLKDITHTLPDKSLLSKHSYLVNLAGNITRWTQVSQPANLNRSWLIGYDAADQLTSVASQEPATFASQAKGQYGYSYDKAGNRLTEAVDEATTTANYNALNQLTWLSAPGDAALAEQSYEWDGENRLTAITYTGNNRRSEFRYDGVGRRTHVIEKEGPVITATRTFVWDGLQMREERDASAAIVQKRYLTGGMQTLTDSTIESRLFARDHLGSVRTVVSSNGTLVRAFDFDPWGRRNQQFGTTDDGSVGFTTYWKHDRSDIDFAIFRAYNPNTSRWISRDTIGENGGINLYGYVANNPINFVDPRGDIAFLPGLLIAWGLVEFGLSAYDLYDAGQTVLDPCESDFGKALTIGGIGVGLALPGGGYGAGIRHAAKGTPGTYRPNRLLPRDGHGNPLPEPDAVGPHTQLGQQTGRTGDYTQAREFDGSGRPLRDIDFTDHGRPAAPGHTNPHQHRYVPNPTGGTPQRGPAQPYIW